ncbi:dephospho-CoA kinase [Actinobacillus delphinicola]|uniref:dephospho-CoA kinase n=1 Tax=Actinobacillus delphinicola TaxID=51161 RepID=UPI002442450E|nr:dephospho-CoA kinase [Actinobacillus delphinicola]MDG6897559.1 dephospho-CoA kinase [Actinobacillus delphinicola]
MSYIVGLTGGIGSGKSTIAYLFAALGVPIVDADIVAREVVACGKPALKMIANHFGQEILLADGTLNRTLLRKKIFENPGEKNWLNTLLHPIIRQECLDQLSAIKSPYVLFVVPLLIENGLNNLCQSILVVDVSEETQLNRTCQRDQQSEKLIKKIISSQISRIERLKWATEIIENNIDLSENFCHLAKEVLTLHHLYLSKSQL